MIRLEVDGSPYTNFRDFSVTKALDNFSGSFSITATAADQQAFPVKVGSECRILVADTAIITGFVDRIAPSENPKSHDVVIAGRGKGADIIDSTLDAGSVELTPPVSLKRVIEKAQEAIGTNLPVINRVSGLEDYEKQELVSCEAGQGAFDFIEQYARKRQVLVTTDGDGNILITRGSGNDLGFKLLNTDQSPSLNNIKSSSATFDHSQRYRRYIVVSQANPTGQNSYPPVPLKEAVDVKSPEVVDEEIRSGRTLRIVAENSSDKAQAQSRAQWEANVRKARSLRYSASVDGLVVPDTQTPYFPNLLVQVSDDATGINARMLINAVTFTVSNTEGSVTSFECVNQDAYTLQLQEPRQQESSNNTGTEFGG